jgi:hypothetical protein
MEERCLSLTHILLYSRVFLESGFRSIGAIANADPKELVPVLMQVSAIIMEYD